MEPIGPALGRIVNPVFVPWRVTLRFFCNIW